jgi:SAM-dependent methyltransferase
MSQGLHDLNPTGRFSDRVQDYVRSRPSYPSAIIDACLDGLGEPTTLTIADIGAGTGISARLFADRGVRTIAIEPNADMRSAAAPHTLVSWRDAAAERTGLAPSSVDLVVCAQAFHWFRAPEALSEFARVLRPRGRAAVMWNMGSPDDPAIRAYYDVVFNASEDAKRIGQDRVYADPFVGQAGWIPEPTTTEEFIVEHTVDGLLGRAMSASYVPKIGPAADRVRQQLREVFDAHQRGGRIVMRYRTSLHRARAR